MSGVRRLTERGHGVQAVNDAEVVELGAIVDDGAAERLEVRVLQDLPPSGLRRVAVPGGPRRGRGLQQLSDLLQGHGVVVVGDLGRVLGDPAQNLVRLARALDQTLHGEERVVAHLLVDEVPRLLLPAAGRGSPPVTVDRHVVLVVRGQRGRSHVVGVVVMVEPSMGVGAALVQRVGRGRRRVGEVRGRSL